VNHALRAWRLAAVAAVTLTFLPAAVWADDPNNALFAAIRNGDAETVHRLIEGGSNVNACDQSGATALMQAALNSGKAVVIRLLQAKAEANARTKTDMTALALALHDPEKVKLLLDHGATIPEAAVFTAVAMPDGMATVKLLADHAAKLNLNRNGYTTLMAAALGGNRETIGLLLENGADVRARTRSGYTALYAAASHLGNADLVNLLLEKGADPNARVELDRPVQEVFTPLMAAATHGDADTIELLLAKGADPNIGGGDFGRTPLLIAVTTGNERAVKLLLDKRADANAQDAQGHTPLSWAKLRGDASIVKILKAAGGREPSEQQPRADLKRFQVELDDGSAKRAVLKSLPLLQKSGRTFTSRKSCVSCHHQSLIEMAVGAARAHGLAVNEPDAMAERTTMLERLGKNREQILAGGGVTDDLLPAYVLASLAAESQAPTATTDALVQFLVLRQRPDGSWRTPVNRPPQDASDFTFAALAVRGLRAFAPKGRAVEISSRIARARKWLVATTPAETEDEAFRLVGLRWTDADHGDIEDAIARLLREQRDDGGWAQRPTLKSDAYATGEVLYALHDGGAIPVDHPAFRRGIEFLLRTQLADGSWFVSTRSFPLQPYVETGFPHGSSQFISVAGTSWATIALTLTIVRQK